MNNQVSFNDRVDAIYKKTGLSKNKNTEINNRLNVGSISALYYSNSNTFGSEISKINKNSQSLNFNYKQ
ncbi:hypothetical protein [Pseudolactococcus raffinolactis]|uniref:hypothetical protein n=1 Tax=Pseudolactococcus raffinolactis TaxID=1366 RepID=UPI0014368E68|nr:hypothetical protein [Lactococcus raffinolactis]QIW51236.1 hypothetical protein GU337_04780 [Lactococcus raffinolactis]